MQPWKPTNSPLFIFIFKPFFTLSEIFSTSCCATELNTTKSSSPSIVSVLIFSSSKNIATLFSFNILTYLRVSNVFLANLEIDFVMTISIFPSMQSEIILWKPSRFVICVPVIASSAYISVITHSLFFSIRSV